MLKKGAGWTDERSPALDAPPGVEYREYQFMLQREGHAFAAGPATFDGDPDLRGITILKADPAVKCGHLRVDVFPWYTVAGRLAHNALDPGSA